MAPSERQLEDAARRLVKRAKTSGTLSELTPRLVREKLEDEFRLAEGELHEFRHIIREATKAAAAEDDESAEEPAAEEDIEPEEEDVRPSNRAKPATNKDTQAKPARAKPASVSKPKRADKFWKAVSSDAEEVREVAPASPPPTKKTAPRKRAVVVSDSDEDVGSAGPSARPPSTGASSTRVTSTSRSPPPQTAKKKDDVNSDSEMSVLEDATPIKRRPKAEKGKRVAKPKGEPKERKEKKEKAEPKGKKAKEAPSKDEETIKRLKSFVVACGVKKQWTKEFASLSRPSQQIQRLRDILAELGMSGRPSMERAREIRSQRELAKELEEVTAFEAKHVRGQRQTPPRKRLRKAVADEEEEEESEENGEEEDSDEDAPRKRKRPQNNAQKDIMAFLRDQSDDE